MNQASTRLAPDRNKVEDILPILSGDRVHTPQGWDMGEAGTTLVDELPFLPRR